MIEIIKKIIDLIMIFVNNIYYIQIDLTPNIKIYMGELFITFLIIVLTIYFILKGMGILSKGDD